MRVRFKSRLLKEKTTTTKKKKKKNNNNNNKQTFILIRFCYVLNNTFITQMPLYEMNTGYDEQPPVLERSESVHADDMGPLVLQLRVS